MLTNCARVVTLAVIATLIAGQRSLAQETGATVEGEIHTAAVVLDGRTLFRVRGVSSFPAEARARLIKERLRAVAADPGIAVDSLRAVDTGSGTRILAGNAPLMAIVEADANLEQVARAELAATHLARLRQAVVAYREARSPQALRRAGLAFLLATLLLAVAIAAALWFWRRLDRFLSGRLQRRIRSVGIQSFELMRAERIWSAFRSGLFALRTVLIAALALVYLGFVLALFPWTRGLSQGMVGFVLGPLQVMGGGIAATIPSLVFLTVLVFVVRLGLRLVRLFFDAVARGGVRLAGFEPEWASPTYKVVRLAVVAFALVVAYPYIPGSDTAAFKGVSLFIGIVFSLGSSSAISNIIAGYMMTYRRALKVGDRVKIGEAIGDVIEMRLQVTHLRSPKNEEIIIPNSQILAGEVLNYSSLARERGLILHTEVGIGYETPWRQVEAMLVAAAERTAGISREPGPFVLEKRLGDFSVVYELNAYCGNPQAMPQLYADLHRNILDVFNEYGVQIMTPAYELDPAVPKVVPRKDWYASPAAAPRDEPGRV